MFKSISKSFDRKSSKNPLVSIIIPVYNRETFIADTLNSVDSQLYRPIEIILVNDGSTDNTLQIVKNWDLLHTKPGIYMMILNQANQGAPSARNRGIQKAKGLYLQFLDSDDTLEPTKIIKQIEILEKTTSDLAICDFRLIDDKGQYIKTYSNNGNLLTRFAQGWSIYTSSPLIRSSLIKGKIYWNPSLKINQDIDFLFKTVALAPNYIYTPGAWCNYFQHSLPRISNSGQKTQYHIRAISLFSFSTSAHVSLSIHTRMIIYGAILRLSIMFFYAITASPLIYAFREIVSTFRAYKNYISFQLFGRSKRRDRSS
ncbi:glycosyltransferase [Synechococcus sp. AH-551-N23]|nr:glycosyltransferase [Synechococcus sp. AH-551-N23]